MFQIFEQLCQVPRSILPAGEAGLDVLEVVAEAAALLGANDVGAASELQ